MIEAEVRRSLEDRLKAISGSVLEFNEDFPSITSEAEPQEYQDRIIAVGQMRSYLSGQVAEMQKILGEIQIDAHNAGTMYEVAQTEAANKVKMKDFDSGEIQKARLRGETLDEYLVMRSRENLLKQAWSTLNYAKTHLEEFQRKATDLKLLVDIMYNG